MLQKDNVNELIKTPKKSFENFLVENGLTNSDAKQYCSYYYDNYWEIFKLSRIINHYEIFRNMYKDSKKFKVHLFDESKLKATELLVIAPDHHGLFSLISGLVSASGYDVVNAKIITRSDGYALDTFFIQNKNRQPIIEEHSKKKLLKIISQGLEGNFNVEKALNKRWEEIPARFRAIKAPTRVIIDNNMSDEYSILEIKCKNAPGCII